MGIYEAMARETVERALEQAIVSGDLVPGRSGWRRSAARICHETLNTAETTTGARPC